MGLSRWGFQASTFHHKYFIHLPTTSRCYLGHIISCVTQHHWMFRPLTHNITSAEAGPLQGDQTRVCVPILLGPSWGHIHWLQCSAPPDVFLIVWHRAWLQIRSSFSSLVVDVTTKHRQPTSTGRTIALQPRCSASAAISAYRSLFLSFASSTASSQSTVSATK